MSQKDEYLLNKKKKKRTAKLGRFVKLIAIHFFQLKKDLKKYFKKDYKNQTLNF